MKILKILGIILLILAVIVIAGMVFLPSEAHVDRSITINAKPAKIFAVVNNLKESQKWSPWFDIDPNTEYTFEGPKSGVGSKMSWVSEHDDVGTGSQWITESVPNESVAFQLLFGGFDDASDAKITLNEDGDGTKVTWAFDSEMNGIWKFFGVMMDNMLGPQYEKGLASLKNYVESLPDNTYSIDISQENTDAIKYLGIMETVRKDNMESIGPTMGRLYGEIMGYMGKNGIESAAMPLAVYPRWEEESFDMDCGIPVSADTEAANDRIALKEIPAGNAVKGVHMGDYKTMEASHWEIDKYIKDNGLEIIGAPWEHYVTDPGQEPDTTKWVTNIYYPVK